MSSSFELTRRNHRIQSFAVVVLLLLYACPAAWAEQVSGNRYKSMANSMFDMMDAFSSEYQKRSGSGRSDSRDRPIAGGAPWSGGYSPWGMGMMSPWNQGYMPGAPRKWWGGAPFGQRPPSTTAPLDGHWQGRSGEILSVDNGWFRIQQNRDSYREGRISLPESPSHGHALAIAAGGEVISRAFYAKTFAARPVHAASGSGKVKSMSRSVSTSILMFRIGVSGTV